jgi:hypothetical protein
MHMITALEVIARRISGARSLLDEVNASAKRFLKLPGHVESSSEWLPLRRWKRKNRRIRDFSQSRFGHLRVTHFATKILGFEYNQALRRIEIDLTYSCNLACPNCNRSCGQARA